jgi:hypothetical protein
MTLHIDIKKEIDGYTASVPAIKGCEVWSDEHEVALNKIINLIAYYLKFDKNFKYRLDITLNSPELVSYIINIYKSY